MAYSGSLESPLPEEQNALHPKNGGVEGHAKVMEAVLIMRSSMRSGAEAAMPPLCGHRPCGTPGFYTKHQNSMLKEG